MATIATTGAARSRTWTVRGAAVAAAIALSLLMATLSASPASANTPSTWSSTFGNGSSYGWTNDHAWAIVTYQDAIAYGSGFIAGQLCGVVSGEECRSTLSRRSAARWSRPRSRNSLPLSRL